MKKLSNSMPSALIIVAAGNSTRMGGIKKEYLPLYNGTVLSESARVFFKTYQFSALAIAHPKNGREKAESALFADTEMHSLLQNTNLFFVEGGKTRQESVLNALKAIAPDMEKNSLVLIHDGARPFVTSKIILDTIAAAQKYGAAVPALQPVDTQKEIDENGMITRHLQRKNLAAVQTPQGFRYTELLEAHRKAAEDGTEYTDDTEIWGKYCSPVKTVAGDAVNKKITWPSDIPQNKQDKSMIRVGLGYDLHKLVAGRPLMLGGIHIPFEKGEEAHSDGDVLLHALTDALLGAAGMGDIGSFFPPEDSKWKDADSKELLKTVWKKITAEGWKLNNADCVIALEQPKFIPWREKVQKSIADVLGVSPSQIFVKAKTGEKMGKIGRGEAVEVWVTCLLER